MEQLVKLSFIERLLIRSLSSWKDLQKHYF